MPKLKDGSGFHIRSWSEWDSNPRRLQCVCGALPTNRAASGSTSRRHASTPAPPPTHLSGRPALRSRSVTQVCTPSIRCEEYNRNTANSPRSTTRGSNCATCAPPNPPTRFPTHSQPLSNCPRRHPPLLLSRRPGLLHGNPPAQSPPPAAPRALGEGGVPGQTDSWPPTFKRFVPAESVL